MFTAYIDDSGTVRDQKVAIAVGLVIPALRLIKFESEWNTFVASKGILDFHASVCAIGSAKSAFAGWEKDEIPPAFARIRQIIKKYGVKCYALAVNKDDYDAVVPQEMLPLFGKYHYTWACKNLFTLLDRWACRSGVEHPLEYICDWMEPNIPERKEIEFAFSLNEKAHPGRFNGHYSFGHRQKLPGLQCVDLIAWTCYRIALEVFIKTPLTKLQQECWRDFSTYRANDEWLVCVGQTRQMIKNAVDQQGALGLEAKAVWPHTDERKAN